MPTHDSHPQNFRRLAELLEVASYDLGQHELPPESETRDDEEAWLARARQCKDELDAICRRWASGTPFRDLPPDQEYFLWIRFRTASEFLLQLDMPANKAIFPYPNRSDQAMFEWLLVDWWNHIGIDVAQYSYDFGQYYRADRDKSITRRGR